MVLIDLLQPTPASSDDNLRRRFAPDLLEFVSPAKLQ
jgi:hypothetical protein